MIFRRMDKSLAPGSKAEAIKYSASTSAKGSRTERSMKRAQQMPEKQKATQKTCIVMCFIVELGRNRFGMNLGLLGVQKSRRSDSLGECKSWRQKDEEGITAQSLVKQPIGTVFIQLILQLGKKPLKTKRNRPRQPPFLVSPNSVAQRLPKSYELYQQYYSKMGLSSSEPSLPEQRQPTEYYSSQPTPTFISSASSHQKPLSQFRNTLTFKECVYTFATLLQQYSALMKNGEGLCISDQHCKVSPFGEIMVARVEGTRKVQPEDRADMMGKLFELVNGLSVDGEWAAHRFVLRLRQRVNHLLALFEDQAQLFNSILAQFSQQGTLQTNLITALTRLNKYAKRKPNSIQLNKIQHSFGKISALSSSLGDNIDNVSSRNREQEKKSGFSHYHRQSRFCESSKLGEGGRLSESSRLSKNSRLSEGDSSQKEWYDWNVKFEDSFQARSKGSRISKKKKCSKKCYISPQFSINIYSARKSQLKAPILTVKRDRYRTQTLNSSCLNLPEEKEAMKSSLNLPEEKEVMQQPKNKASMVLNQHKIYDRDRMQENTPISVLDTMARLVEVRQISSSRSYIY